MSDKQMHPDAGGDASDFRHLTEEYLRTLARLEAAYAFGRREARS